MDFHQYHTIALEMDITDASLMRFWQYFQMPLNIHLVPPETHISKKEQRDLLAQSQAQILLKSSGELVFLQPFNNSINTPDTTPPQYQNCVLFNTSGSSGLSKLIIHPKKKLLAIAKIQSRALNMSKNDTTAICLPTYHVGGLMSFIRVKISEGDYFTSSYKDLYQGYQKIDHLSLVPTMLIFLLKNGKKDFLKQLKTLLIGGAPLPEKLFHEYRDINLFVAHGMTETLAFFSLSQTHKDALPLYELLPGYQLSQGPKGELYLKMPGPREEWVKTHDLIQKVDEKSYFLLGRDDDIIISGGENISLKKIENHLREFFQNDLDHLKLLAINEPVYGKIICAFVKGVDFLRYTNPDYTPKEYFKKSLQQNGLRSFEIPKYFYPLPSLGQKLKYSQLMLKDQINILNGKKKKHSLFFLPGFMDFNADFFNEFPEINLRQFDAHTLNACDINEMVKQVISLTKSPPIIYGYSQGARIAFHLVEKLMTLGIYPKHLFIESGYIGILNQKEREKRLEHDKKMIQNLSSFTNEKDYFDFLDKWYDLALFVDYKKTEHYKKNIENKKQAIKEFGLQLFIQKIIEQLENFSPAVFPKVSIFSDKDVAIKNYLNNPIIPTTVFLGASDQKYLDLYNNNYRTPKLDIKILTGGHLLRSSPTARPLIASEILNSLLPL